MLARWVPPDPLARIAVLRAVVYLFLIYDIFVLTNDVIPMTYAPVFYQPTLLGRLLGLPTSTLALAQLLQVVIVVGALATTMRKAVVRRSRLRSA